MRALPVRRSATRAASVSAAASWMLGLALSAAGCGQKGSVTFQIDAPEQSSLSPFQDPRRDTVVLYDQDDSALGTVTTSSSAAQPLAIGDLPVGHYGAITMRVTGGGALLGLALTRDVDVLALMPSVVPLHARKPLALFGASTRFAGGGGQMIALRPPAPLMVVDSTLPTSPELHDVTALDQAIATATTRDGLWLLAATSTGLVVALDSAFMYTAQPAMAALQSPSGQKPQPRQIAVAPDDSLAAVVTDQGVGVFAPSALASAGLPGIPVTKVQNARAAAWNADASVLAVLSGPSWDQIDCTATQQPPSTVDLFSVDGGALTLMNDSLPAPASATDVAFDRDGALLFAVPCGQGIVRAAGNSTTVKLAGQGIFDVVVSRDRVLGVENAIKPAQQVTDPADSGLRGELAMLTGSQMSYPQFAIPADHVNVDLVAGNPPMQVTTQLLLTASPGGLRAYRAAAMPDGSQVAFLYRIRYALNQAPFLRVDWYDEQMHDTNYKAIECTITVVRDVYRLAQIDTSSGAVGYSSTKGANDASKCAVTCQSCSQPDFFGKQVCSPPTVDNGCTLTQGFVPDGLSILMGSK